MTTRDETVLDVLVVGAGLAGSIAAAALRRRGIAVRVVDRLREPLDEFRAEQIVGAQPDKFRRLGLLAPLALQATPTRATANYRRGAFLDRTVVEQYGLSYQAMVRAVRTALPTGSLIAGRVVRVETRPSRQTVHLADGTTIAARLVVLATGLMPHVARGLGIDWEMKSEAHSLCLGFDIAFEDTRKSALVPFTYYREGVRDRIDYLALFRMGDAVRANLFCYNRRDALWTRDFVADPDAALHRSLPGLREVVGATRIVAPVEMRRNDLKVATNVERDGIVLIGDAFQTSCPATGHGIDRIFSDVAALERLLPAWLASGDFGARKIAQFYADPAKRAFDAECLRAARYRRDVSTVRSPRWHLHRARVDLQRRILRRLRRDEAPATSSLTSEAFE